MKLNLRNKINNLYGSTLFGLKNIKDEETRRKAYILNIILSFFVILSFYSWISWLYNFFWLSSHDGPFFIQFIGSTLFLLLPLCLFRLSIKGKPQIAAQILITLLFLALFQISYLQGVNAPTIILAYTLIIFMSGILISPRNAIVWTFVVSVEMISLFLLHSHKIVPVDYGWKQKESELIDILVLVFIYLVIAIVSWLSSNEINKSLNRAKKSEKVAIKLAKKLEKQNLNLEKMVEKKTVKLRENQLKQLTEVSSLAEFGKLSAGILHDINSPLTVIAMNLDTINECVKKSDADKKFNLEKLMSKSLLAMRTVESIIKTSQKQLIHEEKKELFEIRRLIKNTLLLLNIRANKLGIKIEFNGKEKIKISGYPTKLSRVVANLVMNSIDALEETKKKIGQIKVELTENNKMVLIKVIDNGVGIKDMNKDKIFSASYSSKNKVSRMGLGLHISQEIIKNYFNGEIKFNSEYKKGSVFTVEFPK